jgi:ribosomal protein L11 methyltransferase
VAVDIEENAAATAMENAEKNNITSEQYKTYFGNILSDEALADEIDGKYDMITANIVADVLIAMKDFFLRYIKKGGTLIISGIIEERMEEVLTAVESVGFIRKQVSVKEGWAAAEYTI